MDINIRIAGEAGQGVQTTGGLLVSAFASLGLHVFSTQSYMSRIRGGMNWYDVRIGDKEISSGRERCDLLAAFTSDAANALAVTVAEGGIILCEEDCSVPAQHLAFTKEAKKLTKSELMANSVAAGSVFALLGYSIDHLSTYIGQAFSKKGSDVIRQNIACAKRGAELVADSDHRFAAPKPASASTAVYSGSEAVGLSAATAGVKFVSSYPMSPSTGVFTYLAKVADQYGIVVEQAEDEIAAINMICGAAYAGVPAMTTTSGGGFALMGEGLSLAGMMELPVVVLLSQRPGPATGLPTRTGQEDLRLALHAGHGEFPRALFAPGSVQQAYAVTRHALETAHQFQVPAIILIDQFLADQQQNILTLDDAPNPIDRCLVDHPDPEYLRYKLTEDGISPRALPGSGPFVVCDSDEHDETGHLTEDLDVRVLMQNKRMHKEKAMKAHALLPDHYGPTDAEHLLIVWGSTYGPAREAVDILNADGVSAAMLHFSQLWPLDETALRACIDEKRAQAKRVISVEGNSTGQFASALRQIGALDDCELVLRYDGLPFSGAGIAERIAK